MSRRRSAYTRRVAALHSLTTFDRTALATLLPTLRQPQTAPLPQRLLARRFTQLPSCSSSLANNATRRDARLGRVREDRQQGARGLLRVRRMQRGVCARCAGCIGRALAYHPGSAGEAAGGEDRAGEGYSTRVEMTSLRVSAFLLDNVVVRLTMLQL